MQIRARAEFRCRDPDVVEVRHGDLDETDSGGNPQPGASGRPDYAPNDAEDVIEDPDGPRHDPSSSNLSRSDIRKRE